MTVLNQRVTRKFYDNLIKYSQDSFKEITNEKLSLIKLISAVLTQTLIDLNQSNLSLRKSAEEYLKSPLFSLHCAMLAISDRVALRLLTTVGDDIKDYDGLD